jgi:hypothetical protein
MIAKSSVDAALSRAGVAARGMDLRENRDVDARHLGFDRRAQPSQAPTHDYYIMMNHSATTYFGPIQGQRAHVP